MNIKKVAIEEINPAKYNPRKDLKPGDDEYEKLKRSIMEFDLVEPLIMNKQGNVLVGGHQRLKILKELGHTETDVSIVDLPPEKEKALNIALNKISGEWDMPALKDLLEELDGAIDLDITGFDGEMKAALKEPDFLLDALVYELNNHEYCYTGDTGPALDALGLAGVEAGEYEELHEILKTAIKTVMTPEPCRLKLA